MGDSHFIWEYVQTCAVGDLPSTDCTPVWEFGALSALLLLAVLTFYILVTGRHQGETRLASH